MGQGKSASGSGANSYDYFGSIAGMVAWGQHDVLQAVINDGAEVWPKAAVWVDGESILINNLRAFDGRTWTALSNHTAGAANSPPNATYWAEYYFERASDDDTISVAGYGTLRLRWGTDTQTRPALLTAAGNEYGEDHPDYKNVCYVCLEDWLLGRERVSAPNVELVVGRKPQQSVVTGAPAGFSDGQANVIAIAAELLTSQNGLGLSSSIVDSTSFNAAATALHAKADLAAVSVLLDSQRTFREVMADLVLIGDFWIRYNPVAQLIEAGVFAHGAAPGSSTTLTIDDLTERPKPSGGGWGDVRTAATVSFTDRARAYKQSSDKSPNSWAYRVLQDHRPISLNRPFITRRDQALAHASESLRVLGWPKLSGTYSVRREKGRSIRPGDYVLLDIDLEPGGTQALQYFRVLERSIPPQGPIKITCDSESTIAPIPFAPTTDGIVELAPTVPLVDNLRIFEAPILIGDVNGAVVILAERPNELIVGASVYFDTDTAGDFQRLGAFTNFATRAYLRTTLTDTATTIEVTVPAQVDDERMTDQPGDLAAGDDSLLAILFKLNADQIAETTDGYAWLEVASISAQALASPGNFDLTVLRGRRGTAIRTFARGYAAQAVTASSTTEKITLTAHLLSDGDRVKFGGTTVPAPLVAGTWYYVRDKAANDFKLAATPGGTAINLTSNGTSVTMTSEPDECWIISRASLVSFIHADFDTVRINRLNGDTPDVGYFRLAPYTYFAETALGDAASVPFRFPRNNPSAPGVTLSAPTGTEVTITSPTYPGSQAFTGVWTDADGDMQSWQILLRKAGDADIVIREEVFGGAAEAAFNETLFFDAAGTYYVTLRAIDALGLKGELVVTVTVSGAGAKPAIPQVLLYGYSLPATSYGIVGPLTASCGTPGATMSYRLRIFSNSGAGWSGWSSWADCTTGLFLFVEIQLEVISSILSYPRTPWQIEVKSTKSAVDSDVLTRTIYPTRYA